MPDSMLDTRLNSLRVRFDHDWKKCREVWRDEVALAFEKEYVEPWHSAMETLLRELNNLQIELLRAELFAGYQQ